MKEQEIPKFTGFTEPQRQVLAHIALSPKVVPPQDFCDWWHSVTYRSLSISDIPPAVLAKLTGSELTALALDPTEEEFRRIIAIGANRLIEGIEINHSEE